MSKLRTFLAIDPPIPTKEEIARVVESLKKESPSWIPDGRIVWEDPQKFHITLAFLGNITQEKMERAAKVAQEVAQNFPKLTLAVGSLSYFLKDKQSLTSYKRSLSTNKQSLDSVIFLNILDPERTLGTFYKRLFQLLTEAGFYPPERLSPHITIARLKGKRLRANERKRILSSVADIDIKPVKPFPVSSINIYESMPGGNSTRYHLLKSFSLSGLTE